MRFNSCIHRFAWPVVIGLFLASSARAQFASNVQDLGTQSQANSARSPYFFLKLRSMDTSIFCSNAAAD